MIHHLSLGTNDLKRAKAFYDPVMTVLGLRLLSRDDKSLDHGIGMVVFSLSKHRRRKARFSRKRCARRFHG